MAEDVQRMEDISAPVLAFARENFVVAPGERVDRDAAYKLYRQWCEEDAGHRAQSRSKFVSTLRDAYPCIAERRSGARGAQAWELDGLGWAPDVDWDIRDPDDATTARFTVVQGGR
jgi:hypothetical protein